MWKNCSADTITGLLPLVWSLQCGPSLGGFPVCGSVRGSSPPHAELNPTFTHTHTRGLPRLAIQSFLTSSQRILSSVRLLVLLRSLCVEHVLWFLQAESPCLLIHSTASHSPEATRQGAFAHASPLALPSDVSRDRWLAGAS